MKKKINHFRVDKYNNYYEAQKEGRWTLKEHIQLLRALVQFGLDWEKITYEIPSRSHLQISSHCQKFYNKLKRCKNTELGIDFTSKNINNINDMISQIKSVNKDYNIVNLFLYLSENCKPNKNTNEKNNKNNKNNNINNILDNIPDENGVNMNSPHFLNENDNDEKIINKGDKTNKQIINNNFNNAPINNIYINNFNFYNFTNNPVPIYHPYLNNTIYPNFVNNTLGQNNYINLLDKNFEFNYPITNLNNSELSSSENIKNYS